MRDFLRVFLILIIVLSVLELFFLLPVAASILLLTDLELFAARRISASLYLSAMTACYSVFAFLMWRRRTTTAQNDIHLPKRGEILMHIISVAILSYAATLLFLSVSQPVNTISALFWIHLGGAAVGCNWLGHFILYEWGSSKRKRLHSLELAAKTFSKESERYR